MEFKSQRTHLIHIFTPQPLRLWGIVITIQSGGRAVKNSALTKKLTDEFCLFFTDMTYVPGQFIPYIFFWHQAISGHFPRSLPKKLVGTIMNRWFDCIQIWYGCSLGNSDDLINFWDESIKTKKCCCSHLKKKIDMVVVGVIFFSFFLDIDGQSLWLRGPAIN